MRTAHKVSLTCAGVSNDVEHILRCAVGIRLVDLYPPEPNHYPVSLRRLNFQGTVHVGRVVSLTVWSQKSIER